MNLHFVLQEILLVFSESMYRGTKIVL